MASVIVLGQDHAATLALARAVTTRKAADIEASRLALRSLPQNQREAIAHVVERTWESEGPTFPPRPDQPFATR